MLQPYSRVKVADNSGAKELQQIRTLGGGKQSAATLGGIIVGSVKRAAPQGTVSKKRVVRAVIVRTRRPFRRPDGSAIRFDDNAVVLIDNDGKPIGSRVFGPIAREVRDRGYREIVSLAPEVL